MPSSGLATRQAFVVNVVPSSLSLGVFVADCCIASVVCCFYVLGFNHINYLPLYLRLCEVKEHLDCYCYAFRSFLHGYD